MIDARNKRHMQRLNFLFGMAKDTEACGCARVTAALFIKNDIVSAGWNHRRSDPFAAKYGRNEEAIYFHGETHALKRALAQYSEEEIRDAKTTLYVCRAKRFEPAGEWIWGLSRPCEGCMGAIMAFKIKQVVYTLDCEPGEKKYDVIDFRYSSYKVAA